MYQSQILFVFGLSLIWLVHFDTLLASNLPFTQSLPVDDAADCRPNTRVLYTTLKTESRIRV